MSAALIEQIKDDLDYLKLHRSAEVFATLAETARRDDQSHLEFLAALVAEEAAATRQRGCRPGCASPTSRPGAAWRSSTSASSPPSTPT
jgi:DNA replication protein DnaC